MIGRHFLARLYSTAQNFSSVLKLAEKGEPKQAIPMFKSLSPQVIADIPTESLSFALVSTAELLKTSSNRSKGELFSHAKLGGLYLDELILRKSFSDTQVLSAALTVCHKGRLQEQKRILCNSIPANGSMSAYMKIARHLTSLNELDFSYKWILEALKQSVCYESLDAYLYYCEKALNRIMSHDCKTEEKSNLLSTIKLNYVKQFEATMKNDFHSEWDEIRASRIMYVLGICDDLTKAVEYLANYTSKAKKNPSIRMYKKLIEAASFHDNYDVCIYAYEESKQFYDQSTFATEYGNTLIHVCKSYYKSSKIEGVKEILEILMSRDSKGFFLRLIPHEIKGDSNFKDLFSQFPVQNEDHLRKESSIDVKVKYEALDKALAAKDCPSAYELTVSILKGNNYIPYNMRSNLITLLRKNGTSAMLENILENTKTKSVDYVMFMEYIDKLCTENQKTKLQENLEKLKKLDLPIGSFGIQRLIGYFGKQRDHQQVVGLFEYFIEKNSQKEEHQGFISSECLNQILNSYYRVGKKDQFHIVFENLVKGKTYQVNAAVSSATYKFLMLQCLNSKSDMFNVVRNLRENIKKNGYSLSEKQDLSSKEAANQTLSFYRDKQINFEDLQVPEFIKYTRDFEDLYLRNLLKKKENFFEGVKTFISGAKNEQLSEITRRSIQALVYYYFQYNGKRSINGLMLERCADEIESKMEELGIKRKDGELVASLIIKVVDENINK